MSGNDGCCQGSCGTDVSSADSIDQGVNHHGVTLTKSSLCYRCGILPATLFTRKAICNSCFLEVFRRKFASNLRSHFVRKNEKKEPIIILMGGDVFSTSLLNLILERNKRRYVTAAHVPADSDTSNHLFVSDDMALNYVLSIDNYVDDNVGFASRSEQFFHHVTNVVNTLGNSSVELQKIKQTDHVNEWMILGQVTVSYIALCYFYHEEDSKCDHRCYELKEHMTTMYNSLHCDELAYSLTLLQTVNLLRYMKNHNLSTVSVFVSDTQELIVRRVLMLTCIAAGGMVAFKGSMTDANSLGDNNVIYRLLKTFSSKEVALYHRLNGLPHTSSMDLFWHSSPQSTILGCVNELVTSIASAHSSTLHNVCNVVEKLTPTSYGSTSGKRNHCLCSPWLSMPSLQGSRVLIGHRGT
uniref:Cytoplasmic tRNA 2-thiolation protein 2 n=1 Tax=Babesia bovis TaxID=5865 RepID=A7AMV0_BABBO|eukprot:XP_001611452.1 hypothetical protein [Babesia bovis T2Bo]